MIRHDFFDKVDSEEKAYLFGFFIGDGSFTSQTEGIRFDLAVKDEDHLYKIKNILGGPQKVGVRGNGTGCYYGVASLQMKQALLNEGLQIQKSLQDWGKDVIIPRGWLASHFMRGYFDADGGFSIHTRKEVKREEPGAFQASANFTFGRYCEFTARRFHFFFSSLGIEFTYGWNKTAGTYILQLPLRRIRFLIEYLYDEATVYLERKKELAEIIRKEVRVGVYSK